MPTATRTRMNQDAINELIAKRVDEALKAYDTARNPRTKAQIKNEQQDNHVQGDVNNGNDNGNGNGNPNGTEGIVGLIRWFEKMETVFHISNCSEKYQVKYATCTLLNSALTWWNLHKRTIRTDAAFAMSWRELMKLMTEGLEVGSMRRIQWIRYDVLEFLGVRTTFDIFQNIIFILYFQYGVLVFSGYDVLNKFPLWSLVSAGMDTPYLPGWIRRIGLQNSKSSKYLQNARLLLTFTNYSIITAILKYKD
ncbi:hypothetical protein Tco_0110069 [Tanacetum coccineum]